MSTVLEISRAATSGCYDARRAAALSGVPRTTVYWWARQGIVVPSVSPVQEKLWSYADLMALRIVSWLRKPKSDQLPASPMPKVRLALRRLDDLALDLWSADGPSSLVVDRRGEIFIRTPDGTRNLSGEDVLPASGTFHFTEPFSSEGAEGPDLIRPRPHLRIVPDRVVGEPHIENSRITTPAIFALANRKYPAQRIADMYRLDVETIEEAIDLEEQLAGAS